MDDDFNEQAKEDLNDNLMQRADNEKTKKFLKKLEIQHKVLSRILSPELVNLASNAAGEKKD